MATTWNAAPSGPAQLRLGLWPERRFALMRPYFTPSPLPCWTWAAGGRLPATLPAGGHRVVWVDLDEVKPAGSGGQGRRWPLPLPSGPSGRYLRDGAPARGHRALPRRRRRPSRGHPGHRPGGRVFIFAPNRLYPLRDARHLLSGRYRFGNIPWLATCRTGCETDWRPMCGPILLGGCGAYCAPALSGGRPCADLPWL